MSLSALITTPIITVAGDMIPLTLVIIEGSVCPDLRLF